MSISQSTSQVDAAFTVALARARQLLAEGFDVEVFGPLTLGVYGVGMSETVFTVRGTRPAARKVATRKTGGRK